MSESEDTYDQVEVQSEEDDFQSDPDTESSEEEEESPKRKRAAPSKKEKTAASKNGKATETKKPASKKAKTTKSAKGAYTDKEAGEILEKYINEQNKPFNANTIFENLHKEIKKAQVVRVLATLAQKGRIIEKEYGKSKVYFADQNQFPVVDEAELKQMDEDIMNLTDEMSELKSSIETLRNQIKQLDSSMTNEALEQGITKLTEENKTMEERLAVLKQSETIDPKELEQLRTEITKYQKLWRRRRSQCKEMIGTIADGLDKKDSEICEMIGIETEEELGLPLPFKK